MHNDAAPADSPGAESAQVALPQPAVVSRPDGVWLLTSAGFVDARHDLDRYRYRCRQQRRLVCFGGHL